jgi:hypothetical protein
MGIAEETCRRRDRKTAGQGSEANRSYASGQRVGAAEEAAHFLDKPSFTRKTRPLAAKTVRVTRRINMRVIPVFRCAG